MRRWGSLTEKQRLELEALFCYWLPPEVDLQFEEMKKNDGDAMPFVMYVKERWDEIHEMRRTGVENFRDGYQRAVARMTQDPEQRNPDPFRQALFLWYDAIMYQGRILKVADTKIDRVEIFDLLKPRGRPQKRPTTAEVDKAARKLVHQTPERYKRKRYKRDQDVRSCDQLEKDLVEYFRKEGMKCSKRTIMRRLFYSVFSLEKEFPDLAFPLREE